MPPLTAQRRVDRRDEILTAAEHCFARSGFHQASMQEICAEAGMSPGNLYRYFRSKEEIIAGIAERNRSEAAEQLQKLQGAPDFFGALTLIARYYLVEKSAEEVALCAEIMAESRRNADIAKLYQEMESEVKAQFAAILRQAAARGDIRSDLDPEGTVSVILAIGDGLSWRRAVDPNFDAEAILPLVMEMIRGLLVGGVKETAR
jgi:TetR/AcrR family transcriptional regulator, repressor for uid operon